MNTKTFTITINAPREKVWSTLWEDTTYRKWTAAFAEGSWAKTDWKKGSKALFLDGKNDGMVSTIVDNKPNEFMSLKHLGIVKNGVEDTSSAEGKEWSGALENYTLKPVNGKTELVIDFGIKDIPQEMLSYFMETWPKALAKLKELAEKN
ncbi:MAG TPA: SRPBCC domain-containing protein [Chitinophagaceae bacterium]|nr:SRPBCC domain-containing protein [Chitinophagaceae bacterium]